VGIKAGSRLIVIMIESKKIGDEAIPWIEP
jgi:hypothetical protein